MRLAGPVASLGADHVFDACHRQQVAQLGRVEKVRGDQRSFASGLPVRTATARMRSPCTSARTGSCSSKIRSLPLDA